MTPSCSKIQTRVSSRVAVVVAEQTPQPLVPLNHTLGGFWNAFDRLIAEALVWAFDRSLAGPFSSQACSPRSSSSFPESVSA